MAINLFLHALIVLASAALPTLIQYLTGWQINAWVPLVTAVLSSITHWLSGILSKTTPPALRGLLDDDPLPERK